MVEYANLRLRLSSPMAKKEPLYISILTVRMPTRGRGGRVPFDMLRYDNCVPSSEGDSAKLARLSNGTASEEDRTVHLRRFSLNPHTAHHVRKRWESFGCTVISERPAG